MVFLQKVCMIRLLLYSSTLCLFFCCQASSSSAKNFKINLIVSEVQRLLCNFAHTLELKRATDSQFTYEKYCYFFKVFKEDYRFFENDINENTKAFLRPIIISLEDANLNEYFFNNGPFPVLGGTISRHKAQTNLIRRYKLDNFSA